MRTMTRVVVLLVIAAAVDVRPAQASWLAFYEYLEQLSGPGPFHGAGMSLPIFCGDVAKPSLKCLNPPDRIAKKARTFEIAPELAILRASGPGDLDYPGEPPQVGVVIYGATATAWLPGMRPGNGRKDGGLTRVEVGVTGGVAALHFTGTGVTADDAVLRIGGIVTAPLPGMTGWRVFVAPQVHLGLGPFDRQAFAANPGDRLKEPLHIDIRMGLTF